MIILTKSTKNSLQLLKGKYLISNKLTKLRLNFITSKRFLCTLIFQFQYRKAFSKFGRGLTKPFLISLVHRFLLPNY